MWSGFLLAVKISCSSRQLCYFFDVVKPTLDDKQHGLLQEWFDLCDAHDFETVLKLGLVVYQLLTCVN